MPLSFQGALARWARRAARPRRRLPTGIRLDEVHAAAAGLNERNVRQHAGRMAAVVQAAAQATAQAALRGKGKFSSRGAVLTPCCSWCTLCVCCLWRGRRQCLGLRLAVCDSRLAVPWAASACMHSQQACSHGCCCTPLLFSWARQRVLVAMQCREVLLAAFREHAYRAGIYRRGMERGLSPLVGQCSAGIDAAVLSCAWEGL